MPSITMTNPSSQKQTREQVLRQLNEQYVHACLVGDVEWFRAHLADDFVCIESDGSVHSRDGFLRLAAVDSDLKDYRLDYVDIRFYGDVAMVRASGSWTTRAGAAGISRYIDIYVYGADKWKVVSAQITRPSKDRQ